MESDESVIRQYKAYRAAKGLDTAPGDGPAKITGTTSAG